MTGGEILGYFKNGQFGAEPPTVGGLAGSRAAGPGGGQGVEPLALLRNRH